MWMLLLWGCAPKECPPESCAPDEPAVAPETAAVTPFEREVIAPILADLRAGVEPWDDEGLGVCRGTRTCEEWLGASPGALPAGEYVVRANLRVPAVAAPEGWSVVFETECTDEASGLVRYNRTYDVVYPGAERPFRIGALARIVSPAPDGPRSCSYALSIPHPDEPRRHAGRWQTQ